MKPIEMYDKLKNKIRTLDFGGDGRHWLLHNASVFSGGYHFIRGKTFNSNGTTKCILWKPNTCEGHPTTYEEFLCAYKLQEVK